MIYINLNIQICSKKGQSSTDNARDSAGRRLGGSIRWWVSPQEQLYTVKEVLKYIPENVDLQRSYIVC